MDFFIPIVRGFGAPSYINIYNKWEIKGIIFTILIEVVRKSIIGLNVGLGWGVFIDELLGWLLQNILINFSINPFSLREFVFPVSFISMHNGRG